MCTKVRANRLQDTRKSKSFCYFAEYLQDDLPDANFWAVFQKRRDYFFCITFASFSKFYRVFFIVKYSVKSLCHFAGYRFWAVFQKRHNFFSGTWYVTISGSTLSPLQVSLISIKLFFHYGLKHNKIFGRNFSHFAGCSF